MLKKLSVVSFVILTNLYFRITKVVQQHNYGVINFYLYFVGNFMRFPVVQKYENLLRSDKVTAGYKAVLFYRKRWTLRRYAVTHFIFIRKRQRVTPGRELHQNFRASKTGSLAWMTPCALYWKQTFNTITNIVNLSLSSGQFHPTLKQSTISPLLKKT